MLHPHGRVVLCKRVAPETVTKEGIHIPDAARKPTLLATIDKVGSSWTDCPFKPGETVMHTTHSGVDVMIGEVGYVILEEPEILGWWRP